MMNYYIGRQPILDREYKTVAYGLQFHHAEGTDKGIPDYELTARILVGGVIETGLHKLSGNMPVHIKATREIMQNEILSLFSPQKLCIGLSGDEIVDDELLAVCRQLKHQGYSILLDNFNGEAKRVPLLGLADIVAINMQDEKTLKEVAACAHKYPVKLLARNVETLEEHGRAANLSFQYFQGHFFCKPQLIAGRAIPDSKMAVLRAMQQVMTAESIEDVREVITHDVALSYRLLKYINSAAIGIRHKIESIQQALSLLGLKGIKQWLSVILFASLGSDKPTELVRTAMIRGRILEDIAELQKKPRHSDYFILGLFSLLDALLDKPMEEALERVFLPDDIREGLVNPDSSCGRMLALVRSIEKNDWQTVDSQAYSMGLCCGDLMSVYVKALHWADEQITGFSG